METLTRGKLLELKPFLKQEMLDWTYYHRVDKVMSYHNVFSDSYSNNTNMDTPSMLPSGCYFIIGLMEIILGLPKGVDPKAYRCPNCGAPYSYSSRCDYCRTVLPEYMERALKQDAIATLEILNQRVFEAKVVRDKYQHMFRHMPVIQPLVFFGVRIHFPTIKPTSFQVNLHGYKLRPRP